MSCENGIGKVWSDITDRKEYYLKHPDYAEMWGDVISHFLSDKGIKEAHPSQKLLGMRSVLEERRMHPKDVGRAMGVIVRGHYQFGSTSEIIAALNDTVDYKAGRMDDFVDQVRHIVRIRKMGDDWDPRQPLKESFGIPF